MNNTSEDKYVEIKSKSHQNPTAQLPTSRQHLGIWACRKPHFGGTIFLRTNL